MEIEKEIREIRELISESETAAAIEKTRRLLSAGQFDAALVHLDLIESEWNDIRDQQLNGLLSIDDQMRLQSINRAKLMELLLQVDGEPGPAVHRMPKTSAMAAPSGAPANPTFNTAFKNGLKNVAGIGLLLPAVGALLEANWGGAACFGVAGLITFVPTLRLIERVAHYELQSWHKYVLLIGALLTAGAIYTPRHTPGEKNKLPVEMDK